MYVDYFIVNILLKYVLGSKPMDNHSDPWKPMVNTAPLPVRVWYSQVQVQVQKNSPTGYPCHTLMGNIESVPAKVVIIKSWLPILGEEPGVLPKD
jgi:hypothetical protein